jgi:hypothetical protein
MYTLINKLQGFLEAVFRIRIGFNTDPDPAFLVNADPSPDPDLDPGL